MSSYLSMLSLDVVIVNITIFVLLSKNHDLRRNVVFQTFELRFSRMLRGIIERVQWGRGKWRRTERYVWRHKNF